MRKTINTKWKTSRLSHLAYPLSLATGCICHSFSLTSCEVWHVGKPSIESNYCIHGCCDLCLGCCEQLWFLVYCLLEDWSGVVPHFSLVVCQHLRLVIQHSLAVWVKAKPFKKAAYIFFIFGVVVIGTATFAVGSARPVRFWGALLLRIITLLWGCSSLFPGWVWRGCNRLFLGGCWRDRTGVIFGGCWWVCTGLFLGGSAGSMLTSTLGQVRHKPSHVALILFLFFSLCWLWRRWKNHAIIRGWRWYWYPMVGRSYPEFGRWY